MQFSLKGKLNPPKPISQNVFKDSDDEGIKTFPSGVASVSSSSKPIDYLQIRAEMEKARTAGLVAPVDTSVQELSEKEERAIALKRREEVMGKSSSWSTSTISSTVNLKQAGLVIINTANRPGVTGDKPEPKHIARMVETAQVNEKFKDLLKMKTAEREKVQAESEFGARPEEFVTSSYLKKREENLRLERELEARESESKKRDVSNMFKEMLGSGQYARTQYVDSTACVNKKGDARLLEKITVDQDEQQLRLAEKVLREVVPEDSKEVAKALERQAREEALRIVSQLDNLMETTGNGDMGDDVKEEAAIVSAKQRYMQRKKQRLENNSTLN